MASSKKPQIGWKDPIGDTLQKLLRKALQSGKINEAKAKKIAGKAATQIRRGHGSAAGKKGVEAAAKVRQTSRDVIKDVVDNKKLLRDSARLAEQRAKDAKILKSQGRTLGAAQMGEAVGRKGTKIVRGKEVPVSKAKAEEIITQGQRAAAQRAKGNAARKAEQAALREKVKAAKTAEQRYAAREALKKHKDKYGDFGK